MHTNDSGDGRALHRATYLLLGPPAVRTPRGLVGISGRLQSTLFSLLALNVGSPLGSDRLVDALWGDRPPRAATNALQSQVSRLRLTLDGAPIRFKAGRYHLDAEPASVDVNLFERLLDQASRRFDVGSHGLASHRVEQALALWRGTPFPDLPDPELAGLAVDRFHELRLQAVILRVKCDLALRREGNAIITLRHLTSAHPLREDLWALLVLALYRGGRSADALAAYRTARATLVTELGIEPGPGLRELERAVLRHDPALAGPPYPCVHEALGSSYATSSLRPG